MGQEFFRAGRKEGIEKCKVYAMKVTRFAEIRQNRPRLEDNYIYCFLSDCK